MKCHVPHILSHLVKMWTKHDENSLNKSPKSWICISYLSKNMNFYISSKGIPSTPQHTDSHPCTRPPSWGTRESLGPWLEFVGLAFATRAPLAIRSLLLKFLGIINFIRIVVSSSIERFISEVIALEMGEPSNSTSVSQTKSAATVTRVGN